MLIAVLATDTHEARVCRSGVGLLLTCSVYSLFAVRSLSHDGFDSLGSPRWVT